MRNVLFFFLFFALLLTSCSNDVEKNTINSDASGNTALSKSSEVKPVGPFGSSPIATKVVSSPIPTPSKPASVPTPARPDNGKGTVVGFVFDRDTNRRMTGVRLYLADMSETAIMFQQNSSPSTSPDENGYFVFQNVNPGSYALILWTPQHAIVASQDDDSTIVVTVQPNTINDLNTLVLERP